MGRPALVLLPIVMLFPLPAEAQARRTASVIRTPSADSLAAATRRGRLLAAYDVAAWRGADAMPALSLPEDGIRRLIARRIGDTWEVAAGTLSDRGDTLGISALATPGMQGEQWASTWFDVPNSDTGYYARAARAIESAVGMFRRPVPRPYVASAIPSEDSGGWLVYLYPAPIAAGRWPRGGDARFRVSPDGRVVLEAKRLHESITEFTTTSPPALGGGRSATGAAPENGTMPEDTDVFHVLQRRPSIPELMTVGRYHYRIDVDGTIRLLRIGR